MTVEMGIFLLLAAAAAVPQPASSPVQGRADGFRPSSAVSAHATARIRIVSGVSFGPSHEGVRPAGASRRTVSLTEQGGSWSAELLEFQ